jgi:23S rRNA (cytosine1962-C5)-methyltransferase
LVNTQIFIKSGRDRPIRQRHPWIFTGSIGRVKGEPAPGETVDVLDVNGEWLAAGTWSSRSQIRVRLLSWQEDELLDDAWLGERIAASIALRRRFLPEKPDLACRLVYSEADGLSGLIVDRYGPHLAVQLLSEGMAARKDAIVAHLHKLLAPAGIHDRSDPAIREKEGLPPPGETIAGEAPPGHLIVRPADHLATLVDLSDGQKTGGYLDQAFNRRRVAAYCRDTDVLDVFCYTGGFTASAIAAGAHSVTAIDSSQRAMDLLPENLRINELSGEVQCVCGNAFTVLRRYRDAGRSFGAVILDPPKFAYSPRQREGAIRAYKDINLQAMKLLRPNGVLVSFSCSGAVSREDFDRALRWAAIDARRDLRVVERLAQPPDHPARITFPQSEYLKGVVGVVQ